MIAVVCAVISVIAAGVAVYFAVDATRSRRRIERRSDRG